MTLILAITGMDPETELALRTAVKLSLPRFDGAWQLAGEAEASHVIVDMDSMYGPMSWIRLHASGKRVIGLTSAQRTQADHHLAKPIRSETVVSLLERIAATDRAAPAAQAHDDRVRSADAGPPDAVAPSAVPATPESPRTPAAAADELAAPPPPDRPATTGPAATTSTNTASGPTPAPVSTSVPPPSSPSPPAPGAEAEPPPADAADPVPEESAPPPPRSLLHWLRPGTLRGRWQLASGPVALAFDADARTYAAPAALKPLAPLFAGEVAREAFVALDEAQWQAAIARHPAQPLARLLWLGGLLDRKGSGELLDGHDPQGRYRLARWPETEREFPRHFRIATAMMKGPATVVELAAASGMPAGDVADFVNANLATGFAEYVPPPPVAPSPAEAARPTGLLGRLRGR